MNRRKNNQRAKNSAGYCDKTFLKNKRWGRFSGGLWKTCNWRIFSEPVSGCRQYRLEGVVHTTGLAGGFDFLHSIFKNHSVFGFLVSLNFTIYYAGQLRVNNSTTISQVDRNLIRNAWFRTKEKIFLHDIWLFPLTWITLINVIIQSNEEFLRLIIIVARLDCSLDEIRDFRICW